MHRCFNCGTEFDGKFCPECGTKWEEEKFCPACGVALPAGAKFCSECGHSFTPKKAPSASGGGFVRKLRRSLYFLPELLLALYGILSILFLAGPLFSAELGASASGYDALSVKGMPVTVNCLIALLVFACFAIVGAVICSVLLLKKRNRAVEIGGFCVGGIFQLVFLILSSVLVSDIRSLGGGMGLVKPGACPVCFLVFAVLFLLFTAGGAVAVHLLEKFRGNRGEMTLPAQSPLGERYALNEDAFYGYKELTRLTVPGTVNSIGDRAFYACDGLKSVKLGEGIRSIGNWAFAGCFRLASITIPDSVAAMGDGALAMCGSLTRATIGRGVNQLGAWTFFSCPDLVSVALPAGLKKIGNEAFLACRKLTEIRFDGPIAAWRAIEKGADWDRDTDAYSVMCTDGKITKDGTAKNN